MAEKGAQRARTLLLPAAAQFRPCFLGSKQPKIGVCFLSGQYPDAESTWGSRIVYHHRTVDTLGKMLKAGTISQEMHDAGKDFQAAFIVANLDPLRSPLLHRIPGNGRPADLNDTQVDRRRKVHEALDALGGISSPAGSCAWHVLGCQRSIREWALRLGWGGWPLDQKQAQGILVAGLGVLANHYGYRLSRAGGRCILIA